MRDAVRVAVLVVLLGAGASSRAAGQAPETGPLGARLAAVRALLNGQERALAEHFHESFLRRVPPAELRGLLAKYRRQAGLVVAVRQTRSRGAFFGEYRCYTTTKVYTLKLGVSPTPPHQVRALWLGVIAEQYRSFDQLLVDLGKLPGKVSFALWQLTPGPRRELAELRPSEPLAIGSTFKLYVLGALVAAVARGRARFDRVVSLRQAWQSWPSGVLHDWPPGTPVTLATLAGQMISASDNTATDHLLFSLGRRRIEEALPLMGHHHPERNRPFLSTREMFLLKETSVGAGRRARYLALDEAGRRRYLGRTLAAIARSSFRDTDLSVPTAISTVEWFASTADLCRAADWLRRHTKPRRTRVARQILGITHGGGLAFSRKHWSFVGYKGGSEPGVHNMTWLLHHVDGRWLALAATWNDQRRTLDVKRFVALMQAAIVLLERRPER